MLGNEGFKDLIADVTRVVEWTKPHLPEDKREPCGGWFCLRGPAGTILKHAPIGEMSDDKRDRRREVSAEKGFRLHRHPEHGTSRESRDPDKGQWGGAIRTTGGYSLSFSGLPEAWDETVCLIIAWMNELLTLTQVYDMANEEVGTCVDLLLHQAQPWKTARNAGKPKS